jgi:hypothetical protein
MTFQAGLHFFWGDYCGNTDFLCGSWQAYTEKVA